MDIYFLRYQIVQKNIGQAGLMMDLICYFIQKSFEKLLEIHGFKFINFSYSAYTFKEDHYFQKISQDSYYKGKNSIISLTKIKRILKKIIPYKIIKLRQDLIKISSFRDDSRMNWFVNNTGDNCYIRGRIKRLISFIQIT